MDDPVLLEGHGPACALENDVRGEDGAARTLQPQPEQPATFFVDFSPRPWRVFWTIYSYKSAYSLSFAV